MGYIAPRFPYPLVGGKLAQGPGFLEKSLKIGQRFFYALIFLHKTAFELQDHLSPTPDSQRSNSENHSCSDNVSLRRLILGPRLRVRLGFEPQSQFPQVHSAEGRPFLKMGQPRPLHRYLCLLIHKMLVASGIQTRVVGVEGEPADNLTTIKGFRLTFINICWKFNGANLFD